MNVKNIPDHDTTPGHKWVQRLFKSNETSLVLHDHTKGIYLPNGVLDSAKVAQLEFKGRVALTSDAVSGMVHMVAHVGNNTLDSVEQDLFAPNGDTVPCGAIILQVSSEFIADCPSPSGSFVWLPMKDRTAYEQIAIWLPEFLKLSFAQANKLTEFKDRSEAHEFEAEFPHFLDIILPGRAENLRAFRLLCEAKQLCGSASEKNEGSIRIHAPEGLGQWLTQFGKKDASDIDHVAGLIGSGDIKAKAKAVLEAANGNVQTLMDKIGEFLKPAENTSAQS